MVFDIFLSFKAFVEKQFQFKIKALRCDSGGEYTSTKFNDYCMQEGIRREFSCSYTPQQNGVAERKNRTICECAKALRLEACLPKEFWGEAVSCANYLCNRLPNLAIGGKKSFDMLYKNKPKVDHLRVFGCLCFAHVPIETRKKDDPSSIRGIFIGYASSKKAYRVFIPSTNTIVVSRDVIFHEDQKFFVNEAKIKESHAGSRMINLDAHQELVGSRLEEEHHQAITPRRSTREIILEHVHSSLCLADLLTKPLIKSSFVKMRSNLGLILKSMVNRKIHFKEECEKG